jgi:hypothetical protein
MGNDATALLSSMPRMFPYGDEIIGILGRVVRGSQTFRSAAVAISDVMNRDAGVASLMFRHYVSMVLTELLHAHREQYSVGMLEFLAPTMCLGGRIMISGTVNVHVLDDADQALLCKTLGVKNRENVVAVIDIAKDDDTRAFVDAILSGFRCLPPSTSPAASGTTWGRLLRDVVAVKVRAFFFKPNGLPSVR